MSRAEFYRLVSSTLNRYLSDARSFHAPEYADGVKGTIRALEHAFAEHNEKFDVERFRRDCGVV